MTEQNITKGNRLIAKFLGFPSDNQTTWWHHPVKDFKLENVIGSSLAQDICHFHNSWEWLMPIIKKCYSIEAPTKEGWRKSDRIQYRINENDFYIDNIGGVYEKVVEFITWYNNQKNKL